MPIFVFSADFLPPSFPSTPPPPPLFSPAVQKGGVWVNEPRGGKEEGQGGNNLSLTRGYYRLKSEQERSGEGPEKKARPPNKEEETHVTC